MKLPGVPYRRVVALSAGDEGGDDVGGVAVEVLAAVVVDRGGAWVGVAGGDLHVAQRDSGVEAGHDERCSEHVGVDVSEPALPADGADPAVRGSPVEALSVGPAKDRSLGSFADGEVDGSARARDERDERGFGALAEDLQGPVPAFEAEVFDVGARRLR